MDSTEACVALNMVPGMGPVRLRKLLEHFGSPEEILGARRDQLASVSGVGKDVADKIARWEEFADLAGEFRLAEELGVTILTQLSPGYPKLLLEIHDPPIVLYCRGDMSGQDRHAIGIVGTRGPTHYGQEATKRLAYQLAYAGLTVVSGLARGIDTLAHTAAIAAKGRTIAVIGAGLAELYPPENRGLAERIAGSGAVVSEFPLRTKPDRQTFPMRNRIVSGWSFGVLVVECGINSGALITANMAADQGRSIFAVPGPIDRPGSQGCNRLIQQGARLVMSANDILDELQTLFKSAPELDQSRPSATLDETEQAIYDAIETDETPIDRIISKSGLPSGKVSSTLLGLEMKRLVKQLPGKHYVKLI